MRSRFVPVTITNIFVIYFRFLTSEFSNVFIAPASLQHKAFRLYKSTQHFHITSIRLPGFSHFLNSFPRMYFEALCDFHVSGNPNLFKSRRPNLKKDKTGSGHPDGINVIF